MEPELSLPQSKCPPPVSVLIQINPVQTPTSYFLKILIIIILPSTPGSSQWSFAFRFSYKTPVYNSPLPHTRYLPSHLILFDFITPTIVGEEYRSVIIIIIIIKVWPV
jgi:hypothetical protein